jgi:hypothetical protein
MGPLCGSYGLDSIVRVMVAPHLVSVCGWTSFRSADIYIIPGANEMGPNGGFQDKWTGNAVRSYITGFKAVVTYPNRIGLIKRLRGLSIDSIPLHEI